MVMELQSRMREAHKDLLRKMLGVNEVPDFLIEKYISYKKLLDKVSAHISPFELLTIAIASGFDVDTRKFTGETARKEALEKAKIEEPEEIAEEVRTKPVRNFGKPKEVSEPKDKTKQIKTLGDDEGDGEFMDVICDKVNVLVETEVGVEQGVVRSSEMTEDSVLYVVDLSSTGKMIFDVIPEAIEVS